MLSFHISQSFLLDLYHTRHWRAVLRIKRDTYVYSIYKWCWHLQTSYVESCASCAAFFVSAWFTTWGGPGNRKPRQGELSIESKMKCSAYRCFLLWRWARLCESRTFAAGFDIFDAASVVYTQAGFRGTNHQGCGGNQHWPPVIRLTEGLVLHRVSRFRAFQIRDLGVIKNVWIRMSINNSIVL